MSGKARVLKNSFFYLFSSLLVKAFSFFLLPVYTNFLSPRDFGITNLINDFNGTATYIITLSLYAAVVRFVPEYKENNSKLRRFYGTLINFILMSGIIFVLICILFRRFLIEILFEDIAFIPYILIGLLTLTFLSLHNLHQYILRGLQQGKKLSIINLIIFSIQVFLNLLFIIGLGLDALGVLLASLVINIGYSIFMLFDLQKQNLITFCFDIQILQESLKYSIPILPHNLSTQIASFVSKILINTNNTLSLVGIYGVALKFAFIVEAVQISVNTAFTPWFYEMMHNDDKNSKNEVVELSNLLLIIYSIVYLFIGLFSQEAVLIFTSESYRMAWSVIPILVIAYSIRSIYYFFVNILFYFKASAKKIFIASLSGSLLNIFVSYLLIPDFNMYGAASALVLSNITIVFLVFLMSRNYNIIGYRLSTMIKIICPSFCFMTIGLFFSYTRYLEIFSWRNFVFKLLIFLAYLIYIYFTNKQLLRQLLKHKKNQVLIKYFKGINLP